MKLRDMGIFKKLILAFSVIAILTLAVGAVGIVCTVETMKASELQYNNYGVVQGDTNELIAKLQMTQSATEHALLVASGNPDQPAVNTQVDNVNKYYNDTAALLDTINKTVMPAEKDKFDAMKSAIAAYKATSDKITSSLKSGDYKGALDQYNDANTAAAFQNASASSDEFAKAKESNAEAASRNLAVTAGRYVALLLIVAILAALVAIAFSIVVSRNIGRPLRKLMAAANKLADGDTDIELPRESRDEIGTLSKGFSSIAASLQKLIDDAHALSIEAIHGNLEARSDAANHKGGYAMVIEGVNGALDAIIHPLDEASTILKNLAINDYTQSMSDEYDGYFKELSQTINTVLLRLKSVENTFVKVSKGDTSLLAGFQQVGKRSENDKIMPAAIQMMEAIEEVIRQSDALANAAIAGNLDVRGNSEEFEGDYRKIIEGFNKTLDAIIQPISEASTVLKEMAEGDYTIRMKGDYSGSYAGMKDDINHTIASISDLMSEINTAAELVAAGTSQMSDGAQALSQGATEQASSIEQLTVSIGQIADQTKNNALNANEASSLSVAARDNAAAGNERMKAMLQSMAEINESSTSINRIIKVIDDIAFQTNLLALNAAVEAARAGQHGKGFAVVAEEVRSLAARSASAAQETTSLIETSIKKVEAGSKIAKETAIELNSIVGEVDKVSGLVGEIAVASNEQATAASQVNKGIELVSQVVQTTSATAEESAATSEELSGQAALLKELVGKFRLNRQPKMENASAPSGGNLLPTSPATGKPKISLESGSFGKY